MMRGPLFFLPAVGRLLKPKHKVIGADIAGQAESVGKDVKQFHPGDEVFGASLGGFAKYVCATEDRLALKPSNISFEQAAAVVAAITALQGLRDQGQIERGQRVLIDGASGGVGTFAIQIAKSFGAEVTAVCSPANVAQRDRSAQTTSSITPGRISRKVICFTISFSALTHIIRPSITGACSVTTGFL